METDETAATLLPRGERRVKSWSQNQVPLQAKRCTNAGGFYEANYLRLMLDETED